MSTLTHLLTSRPKYLGPYTRKHTHIHPSFLFVAADEVPAHTGPSVWDGWLQVSRAHRTTTCSTIN